MQKALNVGDPVRFDYLDEQISYEKDFKIPFTVAKTEKKDLYSSGLPMECWETVITVQDANGEIVAEVEDDSLILLDTPQTEQTPTDSSEQEYDPYVEGDAERMDDIRNPRVSMEDMMLKVNQHYGPPSKED